MVSPSSRSHRCAPVSFSVGFLSAFWSLFWCFAHNGVVNPGFAGFHAQRMACWRSAAIDRAAAARGEAGGVSSSLSDPVNLPSAFGRGSDPVRARGGGQGLRLGTGGCQSISGCLAGARSGEWAGDADRTQPRNMVSEDRLEEFFSPGADAAYEISRGRKMDSGRYVFPVTLFEPGTGPSGAAAGFSDDCGPRAAKMTGRSIDCLKLETGMECL